MKLILLSLFILSVHAKDIVMKHMPEGENCIICHKRDTPNELLLRDGTRIESSKVDVLCGQCHGIKHRRWLAGRHGKVTTSWKEEGRKRLSCIVCHDPHAPKFPQFQAKDPPKIRNNNHR